MKSKIEVVELTREELADLFSTALFGSDWLSAEYDKKIYDDIPDKQCQACFEDKLADILLAGKSITLIDMEQATSDPNETLYGNKGRLVKCDEGYVAVYDITLSDIYEACGSEEGYPLALEMFSAENGDYFTANNLLQLAMFGEIIYG